MSMAPPAGDPTRRRTEVCACAPGAASATMSAKPVSAACAHLLAMRLERCMTSSLISAHVGPASGFPAGSCRSSTDAAVLSKNKTISTNWGMKQTTFETKEPPDNEREQRTDSCDPRGQPAAPLRPARYDEGPIEWRRLR